MRRDKLNGWISSVRERGHFKGKKSQIFVHTCMLNVKQYIDVRLDYSWMESELC